MVRMRAIRSAGAASLLSLVPLAALVALVVGIAACNQVWGVETAHLAEDAGGDGAIDPCAPQPGVTQLCVTIDADKVHPGYDVSTGAGGLRIDGSGLLFLFVWDKDPGKVADAKTIKYEQYPPESAAAEVKIDDLPVKIVTKLDPGTYWLFARFEDNKTSSRTGDNVTLGGDFSTVAGFSPSVGRYIYTQVTLSAGNTTGANLTVHAARRVDVDLSADPKMKVDYKNFEVNGDGPVLFNIYDGDYDTAIFLEAVLTHCVNVDPKAATLPTVKTGFVTTVIGTHKLFAALEDFDGTGTFPPKGTLMSSTDAATTAMVNISPSSWSASASVRFISVFAPMPPGTPDPTRCP